MRPPEEHVTAQPTQLFLIRKMHLRQGLLEQGAMDVALRLKQKIVGAGQLREYLESGIAYDHGEK